MTEQPTILLMDEDAEILEQLQTMLQRQGYHVLAAVDGHAALRLARTAHPNLIVSDLLLADLDGYEVWKTLRADKETAAIPILVTSALAVPANREVWRPIPGSEWQIISYNAFLPKPIDLHRFTRVVKKLLQPEQADAIPGGPSLILAIEDQPTRAELAAMLHAHDFGVKIAASFTELPHLIRALPPAALILDYCRPGKPSKNTLLQIKKLVSSTVIILLIDPTCELEADLPTYCDGLLSIPLHPIHTIAALDHILDLDTMRRRVQTLSSRLITTDHTLREVQQALNAQNQELKHVNNRLRELDNLKEMFSGMVVRDLKSPLGAVLGVLSFLQTEPDYALDDTTQYLLTGATAAANQMLRLIEIMLERQRLEDGHLKPEAEPFDFASVVDTCVQQISSLLTLHHMEVKRIIAAPLPPVYADRYISQRILENLLDNAIKFSPRDSTITITVAPDRDFLKISVADEGPGIPKEQQAKIFHRFTRLESANRASPSGGFGLGLTFCHLATKLMNGSIWVESNGEAGTTFLFTLPIYKEFERELF